MKAHHLPKNYCLNCGYQLDAATGVHDGGKPKPGNISICFQCGWISVFDKDLSLRQPNAEEMAECASDARVLLAVGAIIERNKSDGRHYPFKGTKQ